MSIATAIDYLVVTQLTSRQEFLINKLSATGKTCMRTTKLVHEDCERNDTAHTSSI